ncbi:MAG TPA: 16S rRNA (cytidine(1402)-2'-O)-methyltransferase [Candidatus Aquicultor sp.]
MKTTGKLYVCATPIGNLEDITLRALRILKEVDRIAAEDTRVTAKLLARYEIQTPMTSYHEHNEVSKAQELINDMLEGQTIALVSDAGMPGISDPGHRLITACIAAGIPAEPVPGPSALITAVVVSGLPTDSFIYQGFLPRKRGERMKLLAELLSIGRTVVLFESPRRIKATLGEIAEIDSARKTVIARELTKKFEEIIRGTANELVEKLSETEVKGEIVLLCGPGELVFREVTGAELREAVIEKINRGATKKEAIATIAGDFGISKRIVYEAVMDIHEQDATSRRL